MSITKKDKSELSAQSLGAQILRIGEDLLTFPDLSDSCKEKIEELSQQVQSTLSDLAETGEEGLAIEKLDRCQRLLEVIILKVRNGS